VGDGAGSELLDAAASSEARELDERLEDLTAQLEFKNSAIGELRESLGRLGGRAAGDERPAHASDASSLSQQIAHMSLPIARRVLQAEVGRVLELRQSQHAAAKRLEAAGVTMHEREEENASLRAQLRSAAAEHERQLAELVRAHEEQHAALEQQQRALHEQVNQLHRQQPTSPPPKPARGSPQGAHAASHAASSSRGSGHGACDGASPSGGGSSCRSTPEGGARDSAAHLAEMLSEGRTPSREAVEALGKDNFYYRQSNKELRRKLRDERGASEAAQQQLQHAHTQHERDEADRTRLTAELTNMRAYLSAHPGATPTRIAKAALKEITPDAVSGSAPPRAAWPDQTLEPGPQVTPRA